MRIRVFLALLLASLLAAGSGCRGDGASVPGTGGDGDGDGPTGDGDGDTTGDGDGDGDAGDQLIYAVQKGDVAVGSTVNLRGVVITAIDAYAAGSTGAITVQELDVDSDGGTYAYGGVSLFQAQGDVGTFEVGFIVDVVGGTVEEFNFNCRDNPSAPECSDTFQTVTQLSRGTVTQVAAKTTPPAPVVLDPRDVGELFEINFQEAEKWEGVIVQFNDVAAVTPLEQVGSSDPLLQRFTMTGAMLAVSNYTSFEGIENDQCFVSLTGLFSWFFDYQLLPRSAADIVTGGENCPPPENTEELCADLEDNDDDGFIDCADFSCSETEACANAETTVVEAKGLPEDTPVTLSNVVVVGIENSTGNDENTVWVQDANSTADNSGISVYRGANDIPLPDGVQVGSVVNVIGQTDEFRGIEQIRVDATTGIELVSNDGVPAYRTGVPLADLADIGAAGEPYEGQAIELTGLTVAGAPAGNVMVVTDGVTNLEVTLFYSNIALGDLPGDGTAITSIRGVMSQFSGARQLALLSLDDLTTE